MIHLTSMVNGTVSRDAELDTLLGRVAQCDTDALAALYRQTKASVFGYALSLLKNPYDAEDVLHDCFVSIYSAAEGYVSSGKPMAWILTITRTGRDDEAAATAPALSGQRLFPMHALPPFSSSTRTKIEGNFWLDKRTKS